MILVLQIVFVTLSSPRVVSPKSLDPFGHCRPRSAILQDIISLGLTALKPIWIYQKASVNFPSFLICSRGPRYISHCVTSATTSKWDLAGIPFGWIPLLLDLCENTFCLIIDAMSASRHLPIAFYLLLPTHIASLQCRQHVSYRERKNPTLAILLLLASILSSIRDPSPKIGWDKSCMFKFDRPSVE